MIHCKITNNTAGGITLNWVRGGISIPKDSAAILDYDPFSIMDRNSNVYHGAMATVHNGIVSIGYFVDYPAEMIEPPAQARIVERPKNDGQERKPQKNRAFNELDPYHKNEFEGSVSTPKGTKPAADPEPVTFDVGVPKSVATQKPVEAPVSETPAEAAPAADTGKKGSKRSKKL